MLTVYIFKPTCDCGEDEQHATIDDIGHCGWPICPECGEDYDRQENR